MQRDEQTSSLRDELGLELERLAAIDVAPELRVKVQARVARERERHSAWWPLGWQLAGAAAVVTVVATIVAAPFGERETAPVPVIPPSNTPAITIPIVPLDVALSLEPRRRAIRSAIAPSTSRSAHTATPSYRVLAAPPLQPLPQISIEPVAIEPLSAIAPLSGERQ